MDQHHTTVAQLPLLAYADNEMKFLMKKKNRNSKYNFSI